MPAQNRENMNGYNGKNQVMIEYLNKIVELEKAVYTQSQVVDALNKRIKNLGVSTEYRRPNVPAKHTDNIFKGALAPACSGAIAFGVIGLCFGATFTNGALLGAALLGGVIMLGNIMEVSSINKARLSAYQENLDEYNAAVRENDARVKKETEEKRKLIPIVQTMRRQLEETKATLERYYKADIIFPKYRNLIAACSFYEYFLSERCSSLTGHEGAYNIFENEIRWERIRTTLEEVVDRLDEIKANQYTLCMAIEEGNRTMQSLVNASIRQAQMTERIAENSEIIKYNTKQAAICAEASAWIGAANNAELRRLSK